MKLFATLATIVVGITAVTAIASPDILEERACLKKGAKCKKDGSIGSCCSKYCLQLAGVSLSSTL